VNQTDACLEQIKRGMAWHYKQYANEQSPEDRDVYAQAESTARAQSLGLWKTNPLPRLGRSGSRTSKCLGMRMKVPHMRVMPIEFRDSLRSLSASFKLFEVHHDRQRYSHLQQHRCRSTSQGPFGRRPAHGCFKMVLKKASTITSLPACPDARINICIAFWFALV